MSTYSLTTYDSAAIYIETSDALCDKIDKLDAIIAALETAALTASANQGIEEYELDDGQVKIKTKYRNAEDIIKSINAYEKMRQLYINRLNKRVHRLVDSKNVIGRTNGRT